MTRQNRIPHTEDREITRTPEETPAKAYSHRRSGRKRLRRYPAFGGMALMSVLFASPLLSRPARTNQEPTLEERIATLEEEVEKNRHEKSVKQFKSVNGMGPAASEVYNTENGFSMGGYGEAKYRNYRSPYLKDEMDLHRLVLYAGYRFNDWIVFNSEIEYEHAGFENKSVVTGVDFTNSKVSKSTVKQSEVGVEFAYIDLMFAEQLQLALGLNLIPVGMTNYMHEPTTFFATERPYTETFLIPTTWREPGAVLHGRLFGGDLTYRTGVFAGGDGTKFSETKWLKDTRSKGSNSPAEDFAAAILLDYEGVGGLLVGGSYYAGDYGQNQIAPADWKVRIKTPDFSTLLPADLVAVYDLYNENKPARARVRVNLAEAHFRYETGPFSAKGLAARGWMNENDARSVNRATGKNIGMVAEGGYVELGYDLLGFAKTEQKLVAFLRGERLNTQQKTVTRNPFGREALTDQICSLYLADTCHTTADLKQGNRDLGIIENSDTTKELYGVNGVADRGNDRRIVTTGLAYYPHPNVVLKLEYERHETRSDALQDVEFLNPENNKSDQVNFAVGFIF